MRVPHAWRRATIIPIKKPGKPAANIGSHRPISLTSCVAKLTERMVKNRRMYWWLETNQKLDPLTTRLVSVLVSIRHAQSLPHRLEKRVDQEDARQRAQ